MEFIQVKDYFVLWDGNIVSRKKINQNRTPGLGGRGISLFLFIYACIYDKSKTFTFELDFPPHYERQEDRKISQFPMFNYVDIICTDIHVYTVWSLEMTGK